MSLNGKQAWQYGPVFDTKTCIKSYNTKKLWYENIFNDYPRWIKAMCDLKPINTDLFSVFRHRVRHWWCIRLTALWHQLLHFQSSFLLMYPGGQWRMPMYLSPCHPCGKSRWSFLLLASVWQSPGHCSHVHREPLSRKISLLPSPPLPLSFPLSPSLILPFKQIFKSASFF